MKDFTLFFCPDKDIHKYAKTIPGPKVGCSSVGEIDMKMTVGQCVQMKLSANDFNVEVVKIANTGAPVVNLGEIKEAAKKAKAGKRNLVCMVLNDGLSGNEELMQSFLLRALPPGTPIVGASAADNLEFKQTYCCIDEDVFTGAVVVLLGTNLRTYIHKENIYEPTDKYTIVTRSQDRNIMELDGVNARARYANILNESEISIEKKLFNHPFGRYQGDELMICSPQAFNNNGSLNTYRASLPSSVLWMLELGDYKQEIKNTTSQILRQGTPVVTIAFNCILRRLLFEQERSVDFVSEELRKIKAFGFTCYGEQLNGDHLNQTLITLSFYR